MNHLPERLQNHIQALGGIRSLANHPMTPAELNRAEEDLCAKLPSSLRQLLLDYGSCTFNKAVKFVPLSDNPRICDIGPNVFFGSKADGSRGLLEQRRIYKDRIPNCLTPIADNLFGDLICLGIQDQDSGRVYFWDHENELDRGEFWANREPEKTVPREFLFQNVHLIANSLDDFLLRIYVWDGAYHSVL